MTFQNSDALAWDASSLTAATVQPAERASFHPCMLNEVCDFTDGSCNAEFGHAALVEMRGIKCSLIGQKVQNAADDAYDGPSPC